MQTITKNFQTFTKLKRKKYLGSYVIIIDGEVRFWGKEK
jgi:hypothetical protein